jgi:tripartite-type tricarboxylate transporter receptor subunit TctC
MPDVPSVAESGVADFDVRSWMGLATSAGTPQPVIDRLNAEMQRTLRTAGVRSKLEEIGGEVRGSTPGEMRSRIASELKNWTQVIRQAKVEHQ